MLAEIAVDIPIGLWEPIGPEDDPKARLLSTISLNGMSMHADAVAVREVKPNGYTELEAANPENEETLSRMIAVDPECMYHTLRIGRRNYVVVITPFGR